MIVTCPTCAAKYRVRDEAVPPGGAELECPTCKAIFVAHPPRREDPEVTALAEKLVRQKEQSDKRQRELEASLSRTLATKEELTRKLQDRELELARLEAQLTEAQRRVDDKQSELVRSEARAQTAEASLLRLGDELRRTEAQLATVDANGEELTSVKLLLLETQRRERQALADIAVANQLVASLQAEVGLAAVRAPSSTFGPGLGADHSQQIAQLNAEITQLQERLSSSTASSTSSTSSADASSAQLRSLVAAVGPLLWGLEQSLAYFEQFAGNEPALANHVRQLRLLQKVLQRLVDEGA